MNETVTRDFLVLFLNLGAGIGIGLLFDCYRVLRSVLRPGWFCTQVADFFFWVLCAALVFGILFLATGGEVRFYTLLIIPAGLGAYLKYLSPRVRVVLFHFFLRCGRLLRFCFRVFGLALHLLFLPARFSLQLVIGLIRLCWLPELFFLRLVRRKVKEAVRALKFRRPPAPPPEPPVL